MNNRSDAKQNKSADANASCDLYDEKSMPELSSAFHDKYEEMVKSEIPDLWARIESALPEKHVETTSSHVVVMHPAGAKTTNAEGVNAKKRRKNIRMWSGILAACACVAICVPAIIFAQRNSLFKNEKTSNSESLVANEAEDKEIEEDGSFADFFQGFGAADTGASVESAAAEDMSDMVMQEEMSCEAAPEDGTGIAGFDDATEESDDATYEMTDESEDAGAGDEDSANQDMSGDRGTDDASETVTTEETNEIDPADYIYYNGNSILDKAEYTVEELHYENDVLTSMVVRGDQNRRYVIIPTEGRLVIEQDEGIMQVGFVTLPEDLEDGDVLTMKLYDATALTGGYFLFKLY